MIRGMPSPIISFFTNAIAFFVWFHWRFSFNDEWVTFTVHVFLMIATNHRNINILSCFGHDIQTQPMPFFPATAGLAPLFHL
jgi:hypothetical protein